ncbi:hypothetical protein BON22_0106 [Cyberlindnera fabianii]|uniref:Uncharacterized protein n=1 Tax=Cyberlindnera fabianii TaxID=36022 RepID=A0A1V2LF04_CYBFA|nr:hypothetical protein BON22_0106 [Cyberlindnera fabianii]
MTATAPPSPRENSHVSVDKKKPSVKSETESTSIPVMAASAGAGANDTVVKQQCTPDQIPTVSDEHAISKESTSSPRTDIADSNIVTLKETPSTEGSSPALPKLQLPPIEHVLQKIDAYQNEQKLFDSQLLLNFKERSNSNSDLEKADELSASDSAFADDVSVTSSNADSASTSMKDLRTMHTVNTTMDISFKSNVPGSRRLSSVDSPNAGTMSVLNIGPDLTNSYPRASDFFKQKAHKPSKRNN